MVLTFNGLWVAIVLFLLSALAAYFFYLRRQRAKKILATKDGNSDAETLSELIPESKYIEFNGVNIHYVQAGQGPDLVLLHGIGASVFIWRYLFPLLQTHFRVTAIDLPGFGKSSKSAKADYGLDSQVKSIAGALKQMGINEAGLVGSSMGGAIALWLGKSYPKRFTDIAVVSPATDSSLIPSHIKHFSLVTPVLHRAINKRSMRLILSRVVARQSLITDQMIEAYLAPFIESPAESVRAFWSATSVLSDKRLPGQLADIQARTLVIYGERDLLVSWRSMQRLLKHLPDARYLTNKEGGHHLMEDDPTWLAQELEKFFTH